MCSSDLLHACGLDWDEFCMHFQQATHAVQTASAAQVRRPLSAAAVGVWQHYAQQLAPLLPLLEADAGSA